MPRFGGRDLRGRIARLKCAMQVDRVALGAETLLIVHLADRRTPDGRMERFLFQNQARPAPRVAYRLRPSRRGEPRCRRESGPSLSP